MVLDTMTLEELIREIKTDFSEVKGRWKNYVRKVMAWKQPSLTITI